MQCEGLRSELERVRDASERAEAALHALVKALESKLEALQQQHRSSNAEREQLRTQLDDARAELQALREQAEKELASQPQEDAGEDSAEDGVVADATPTQLAARLEAVTKQLYRYKTENHRYKESLATLVEEVESKAPAIQNMRREWEEAQKERERLSVQLRRALAGHAALESTLSEMRSREQALQAHCKDLGKQVATLMHQQVQEDAVHATEGDLHLVTFADVSQMQRNNAQLLLALRNAQQQQTLSAKERAQLHSALDELRTAREQHTALVAAVEQQRAMYRTMMDKAFASAATQGAGPVVPQAVVVDRSEEVEKERAQRVALEEQVLKLRSQGERLKSTLEWAEKSLKIAQDERVRLEEDRARIEAATLTLHGRIATLEARVKDEQALADEERKSRHALRESLSEATALSEQVSVLPVLFFGCSCSCYSIHITSNIGIRVACSVVWLFLFLLQHSSHSNIAASHRGRRAAFAAQGWRCSARDAAPCRGAA